jgi:hypothetical protein
LCSIHSFCVHFFWAYCCVHSRAVLMASGWFSCACVRNAATCPVRLTKKWHRTYLPLLRHGLVKRILWVRCTEQCLDAQQDRADLKGGRPVVLQYVEADATQSVDVRVIDASQEAYPRWAHGVVVGQEELEVELAAYYPVNTTLPYLRSSSCVLTLVTAAIGPIHPDVEVSCVLVMWLRRDTRHWFVL